MPFPRVSGPDKAVWGTRPLTRSTRDWGDEAPDPLGVVVVVEAGANPPSKLLSWFALRSRWIDRLPKSP